MKKQIWVYSHPLGPPAPGQPSKPEGAEEIQVKGHQREVVGLRLGTEGGRARTPVDQAWGSISQSLLLPPLSAPGPILVMHIGTCQGLASQGPEGAPAGDFKSPNAFQKGTKTFCLTKASTGEEQPSPFLFKSIFQPAGLVILFFSYYKRSQLQHTGKKNHLPGLDRGRSQPQPPGWPPAADKGGSSLRHPLGEALEPLSRAKATAGARGGFGKFLPALQTFSCPGEQSCHPAKPRTSEEPVC